MDSTSENFFCVIPLDSSSSFRTSPGCVVILFIFFIDSGCIPSPQNESPFAIEFKAEDFYFRKELLGKAEAIKIGRDRRLVVVPIRYAAVCSVVVPTATT